MATTEMNCLASGGGGNVSVFLGSDANNGTKTWDYDAKIVVASLVNSGTNHTIIFDLLGNRAWVMKNASSTSWKLENPSGTSYTATARSFSMTIPSGFICNMVIPLDVDFPTTIPT